MMSDEETTIEPFPDPDIPDFDDDGQMRPPWAKYPNLPRGCMGWRMGVGESYLDQYAAWWARQPRPFRLQVRDAYPEPDEWVGYWRSLS
jgi:hypothetical protein